MSPVAGSPSAFDSAMSHDLAHLGMTVTPENIVHVSSVLQAESDYLRTRVRQSRNHCRVGEPGLDPVSPKAASGFNGKIGLLLEQCQAYCDTLAAAADELARTARSYGHTDDDIRRSLESVQANYGGPIPNPPAGSPR